MEENTRQKKKRRGALCVHDIDSPDNTLIKIATRKMVYPLIEEYYCLYCKRIFRYQKESEDAVSLEKEK